MIIKMIMLTTHKDYCCCKNERGDGADCGDCEDDVEVDDSDTDDSGDER